MNDNGNNRNMMLFVVLSAAIFGLWYFFIGQPAMKAQEARNAAVIARQHKQHPDAPAQPGGVPAAGAVAAHQSRGAALAAAGPRIRIDTPSVDGSLVLKGARFDDLQLKNYRETADKKSPEIVLLSPKGTDFPYFVDFGWSNAPGVNQSLPNDQTVWKLKSGTVLAPNKPVTLEWDNGHGLIFTRQIAVDEQFMFTVTDSVVNKGTSAATIYPYALVVRVGAPQSALNAGFMTTLHEGFVGVAGGSLNDPNYSTFKDEGAPPVTFDATGGWAGITDKYWMAAVIPPQQEHFNGSFSAHAFPNTKSYQADYRLGARTAAAGGGTVSVTHHLFAGAKVVDTLRHYERTLGVDSFDLAIDWGWFRPITQPLFWVLDYFYKLLGNFGLAILLLTVVVKLITFPIANASAKTMAKMKKVQPEQEKIKERFKDDPAGQQAAVMELYRREKVNPVTGCVPQLLVIPVFFSLYKVMYVTIEMRQAPFFGWIHDLASPDPTSILNLFGLLPYNPHLVLPSFLGFLSIGILPILMGITQWVQTKLNPAPADPIQARMFGLMPIMFTFMFAAFPAGLVIYYTWNNILGVAQQWYIMSRNGVEVHLFKNLRLHDVWARLTGGAKAPADT
ncbi:MAG TPA: membrane protein insertase YidC [Rhizomicrobium sp.]|jgi:YidC/Oxa1 family membrane protein insertase|nr:membrane protein insertase YidC [Rhizomicrobium sp.]